MYGFYYRRFSHFKALKKHANYVILYLLVLSELISLFPAGKSVKVLFTIKNIFWEA